MKDVPIKVYAAFYPVPASLKHELLTLAPWIVDSEDFVSYEGDMVQLCYEGLAFPVEDALEILQKFLPQNAQGKMDVFDLTAWTLTRHTWEQGKFISTPSRDLNSILAYSGH